MSSQEAAQELAVSVRRWATALRAAQTGSVELESRIIQMVRGMQAVREEASRDADERFSAFYQNCPASIVLTDRDGVISAANPAFVRLAGVGSEASIVGAHISGVGATVHDRHLLRGTVTELAAVDSGRLMDRLEINAAHDRARLVRMTATTLPGKGGEHPIFMFEDEHELRELRSTFQHQGLHDPLTGLPNNAHFRSKLEAMLAGGVEEQVAILFLDIDGFKVVSDGLGTQVADDVLRGVAGALREIFAEHNAFLARLFGDGFAVALRGEIEPTSVVALAEQAIEELARPVYVEGIGVGVSASVGIVVADTRTAEHTEMIRAAEVALHRAKDLGKAQWVLFDQASDEVDRERYRLACGIAGALETGEMTVAYQPHAVLPDAQIVTSLNAVLHWAHPTLGTLRPHQFHPLAETTGMTVALGRHLLSEALRTTADWRSRFGADAPMVCVTLPRRMAIDGDLVSIVRAELDSTGLEPRHLMLCTDAPALLDERGDLLESIDHLARLGVLFILDITGMPDLELVPALAVPVPAVMLTGAIVDALDADDPPAWAERNVRQLVERATELGIEVGAHDVRSQHHAELLFAEGVVVAAGPYLPEHAGRKEAETWVGRTFPLG